MSTLQEWRGYQEPSVRGLDSHAVALARATIYEHHQSHGEPEVANIDHIRLYWVWTFYPTVRTPKQVDWEHTLLHVYLPFTA